MVVVGMKAEKLFSSYQSLVLAAAGLEKLIR
jgi:hypothetical protein